MNNSSSISSLDSSFSISEASLKLDVFSWITLVVFLISIFFVIRPVTLRCRCASQPLVFSLNFVTAPAIACLLLLLCTALPFDVLLQGLTGVETLRPYSIVLLFFSLSIISVSLDVTGLLAATALRFAQLSKDSGRRLFFVVFLLSSALTIVTSNDIVIMTLTPIILYCCSYVEINPIGLLFTEYFCANVWSALLYIGNPTNIIVAQANSLSFIEYSKWCGLPTLAAGVALFVVCWFLFGRKIPRKIKVPRFDARSALQNKLSAVLGGVIMILSLVTLIVLSFTSVPVWLATLPFALLTLIKDAAIDFFHVNFGPVMIHFPKALSQTDIVFVDMDALGDDDLEVMSALSELTDAKSMGSRRDTMDLPVLVVAHEPRTHLLLNVIGELPVIGADEVATAPNGEPFRDFRDTDSDTSHDSRHADFDDEDDLDWTDNSENRLEKFDDYYDDIEELEHDIEKKQHSCLRLRRFGLQLFIKFATRFPTVTVVLQRQPWSLVPFILAMFVLVEALSFSGWTDLLAAALAKLSGESSWRAASVLGVVTVLACNVFNNQPTTILLTRVVGSPFFVVPNNSRRTALFALALGSNFGANLTLIGALAGIMWIKILEQDESVKISYFTFLKYGVVVTPALLIASIFILSIQETFIS